MKLELLHADDPLSYWVVSVVDSFGLRVRLRLEGSTNEADDAWVYFLSDNVHQLGFGKKHNLRLNVPSCEFSWPLPVDQQILKLPIFTCKGL